jgi:HrpA-like RNA helicase
MPGSKDSETTKEPSEFEKKKMSIEETKRSLPVFPFKQDLIDAVREHQVHLTAVLGIRIGSASVSGSVCHK